MAASARLMVLMSPEERATRLYNRVMTLHSAGKTDSAEFFLPMALQAYAMLPALDIDARYHVGVLHLAGGDAAGAPSGWVFVSGGLVRPGGGNGDLG